MEIPRSTVALMSGEKVSAKKKKVEITSTLTEKKSGLSLIAADVGKARSDAEAAESNVGRARSDVDRARSDVDRARSDVEAVESDVESKTAKKTLEAAMVRQDAALVRLDAALVRQDAARERLKTALIRQDKAKESLEGFENESRFTISVLDSLVAIESNSSKREKFTNRCGYGMLGRCGHLTQAMSSVKRATGTAIKERNQPIAVISAPRQGKSLFLDELCDRIARELDSPLIVKLTLNQLKVKAPEYSTAEKAIATFWSHNVLNLAQASDHVFNGQTTKLLLERYFPSRQIVLVVDELTKITDSLPADQHRAFAEDFLTFLGPRSVAVFSGFDMQLSDNFLSASGRRANFLLLDPILPQQRKLFRQLLPLKSKLFNDGYMYNPSTTSSETIWSATPQQKSEELSQLLLHYELCKTTPGVLGAIVESLSTSSGCPKIAVVGEIPVLKHIKTNVSTIAPLVHRYCQECLFNNGFSEINERECSSGDGFPPVSGELGRELLRNKIGVPSPTKVGGPPAIVVVPPIFAYYAMLHCDDWSKKSAYQTAINVIKMWLMDLLTLTAESGCCEGEVNDHWLKLPPALNSRGHSKVTDPHW